MDPTYATVEQLQAAADFKPSAYEQVRLLRLLDSASRKVERVCHRRFYPLTEARTYHLGAGGEGFWLDTDLLSITSATADSVALTVGDIEVSPASPPYSWVGITGVDITITGVWGYSSDTTPAGALAEGLDASETGVDITDSSLVGVGDLILVDSERMQVTGKTLLDTTANMTGDMTALDSDTLLAVNDGTLIFAGEVVTAGTESMLVVSISGNNITVKRAWDGTVLAAHSQPVDLYAPRTLTVERGAAGTTAASHLTAAAVTRNLPPAPITEATIAEALTAYGQETSGYARTIGSGDNQREAVGASIGNVRERLGQYRRIRVGAI